MRNDIAVFILTHGRARDQKTYKTLKDCGYNGRIYLIIDDMDNQKKLYEELYGDQVICFKKQNIDCDTFTNQEEWRSVLYARNATYEIAKNLGLSFVFMCDDDITKFNYRIVKDGKLKGFDITDFNALLDKMAEIMAVGDISIFGFSQSGSFVGGANSQKYIDGCQRTCSQAMMVNIGNFVEWRGILGEDLNASLDAGSKGKIVLSTMLVSIQSPERTTNKGGLHDLYENNKMYVTLFYSLIAYPGIVSVRFQNGEWKHRIKRGSIAPMILSDRHKKCHEK